MEIDDKFLKRTSWENIQGVGDLIDLQSPSFWLAVGSTAFAPIFWNIVGRFEYRTKAFSSRLGSHTACYILAAIIFLLSIERDWAFYEAIKDQVSISDVAEEYNCKIVSLSLWIAGSILVLTSFFRLGITGTYLGDYFGILMKEMVTGFPFSIASDPMYLGSVMNFLSTALWFGSPTGVVLSIWTHIVYKISVQYFEGPFTTQIYADKAIVEKHLKQMHDKKAADAKQSDKGKGKEKKKN
eukprot:CAMPEP_0184334218 /NCGR_PEP_ID=MMETSP1089-20130417/3090_1 /TAXON_ID=38269 ORGANISM="Gloeochaete wittrockiana, Strain SAG46.84" /NCGR_SAMPLE_ID=MMETSP1089 /ASSEMBLY_ACC=CAM_ASM_000445 /LENGTH=239 /DNA_ID=CAMNT_0026658421 /DNA_START=38 /DNA_END=757 /DNA_ORIENTATION=-